jgi:hypothetical protein
MDDYILNGVFALRPPPNHRQLNPPYPLLYSSPNLQSQVHDLQIGSAGLGLTTYYGLRRRVPPVSIGVRLLVSGGMGVLGSFLGFTMGGFAASLEVNHKMEDPKR